MYTLEQTKLTPYGILQLIDEHSTLSPLVLQITNVSQKAFGFVTKCQIVDTLRALEVIIKINPDNQARVKKYDLIMVKKQNVKRHYVGESYYLVIEVIEIIRNQPPANENERNNKRMNVVNVLVIVIEDEQQEGQTQARQRSSSPASQLLTLQQLKSKGENYNRVRYKWKIHIKVIIKSQITTSCKGTRWFECLLEDSRRDKIDFVVFDRVDQIFEQLQLGQYYQIEKPLIFNDKFRGKSKLKATTDTKITHIPIQCPVYTPIRVAPNTIFNVPQFSPNKNLFNKIAYCFFVQIQKGFPSQTKPIVIYIVDCDNNMKKINIWRDHNVTPPQAQSYIYIKNLSHRGDPKAQMFHSTRQTCFLTQKQSFQLHTQTLNTFSPDPYLFYRKPYYPNIQLTPLSQIFKGGSYYYVSVLLIFDLCQIKIKSKCQSCSRILDNDTGCSCNKPNTHNYYNVRCRISDNTGSINTSVHSTLVEMIGRVKEMDSGKVAEEKVRERLMRLNLKREVVKLQVKFREERQFVNLVDMVERNVDEEIKMLKRAG